MAAPAIHIVGAGLAGLSAAVRLAGKGARIIVHEAANQAGGRCRSYHDPALGMNIDNGNHLLLSGNIAALDYLRTIGAQDRLAGPDKAEFLFADLKTNTRWTLRPNDGRIPWWICDPARRVPGTRAADYLALLPLLRAGRDKTIADVMPCHGALYERLWQPLFLAALNTDPHEASAQLAASIVRETLMAGGKACRPLIARDGLGAAFVDPALRYLEARGAAVRFGQRLRAISFAEARAIALDFGEESIALAPEDAVILAVPPTVASGVVPGLTAPTAFRAIVNAHFRLPVPREVPMMTGLVNSLSHWLFAFEDRLSVTISGADHLLDTPRETLAGDIWREVAAVTGLSATLPPWQIVRERRATFAALPDEDCKRPATRTRWGNLVLAGDWIATGLPATIEGAIRSGTKAADSLENAVRR